MTATCSAGKRGGGTCGRPAGWGTPHPGYGTCKLHAGSTRQHVIHAERLRIADEETRIAAQYGVGEGVDVLAALQTVLDRSYGVAAFWQARVQELESLSERGPNGSTDVHHAIRAEERARAALLRVAPDAARLGVEARRAAVNQQDAEAIVEVLKDAVGQLGGDPDHPDVRAALAAALRRIDQRRAVEQ